MAAADPNIAETSSPDASSAHVEEHNRHQIDYFSHRSLPRMDPTSRSTTPYTQRHLDAVIDAVGITSEDRVLDVGCGPGKYTIGLSRAGIDVEGLDLTPALIEQLREVAPSIPAHVGDLADPPEHLRNSFDVVTGFFMLHHVPDLEAAFAGVAALLRPGGRAAFCEPNPLFPGYYLQITLTPGMTWKGDGGILRMWPRFISKAGKRAGLGDFRTERFGAFPPALANNPTGRRVEDLLEAVPGWNRARAFQIFTFRA